MDIFFKNDGSYSQSTVGIPVLVDYTPVGFVREVNADMVTCSLFDKFIGKEWLAQRLSLHRDEWEMRVVFQSGCSFLRQTESRS